MLFLCVPGYLTLCLRVSKVETCVHVFFVGSEEFYPQSTSIFAPFAKMASADVAEWTKDN